jgi:16S rRNA (guanine527-N7)-methyltransferase
VSGTGLCFASGIGYASFGIEGMTERKLSPRGRFDKAPRAEFEEALAEHAGAFGVRLSAEERARLGEYFALVSAWNGRLHLVAPCPPEEFATRHVLESLLALPFIGAGASVVDVGSGAGLPAIPCLVARADLSAVLVESSPKKAVFLREALARLGRSGAARVVAERFEKLEPPEAECLTCRALERFTAVLPHLLAWAARVPALLLFGGESLREKLGAAGLPFEAVRVPESERRFLFVVRQRD